MGMGKVFPVSDMVPETHFPPSSHFTMGGWAQVRLDATYSAMFEDNGTQTAPADVANIRCHIPPFPFFQLEDCG